MKVLQMNIIEKLNGSVVLAWLYLVWLVLLLLYEISYPSFCQKCRMGRKPIFIPRKIAPI